MILIPRYRMCNSFTDPVVLHSCFYQARVLLLVKIIPLIQIPGTGGSKISCLPVTSKNNSLQKENIGLV